MGLDPGDDFWPGVCAYLAPDEYSEMLQPNPNLAWILNDTSARAIDEGYGRCCRADDGAHGERPGSAPAHALIIRR